MFSFLTKTSRAETTQLTCIVTSYSVVGAIVRTYHTQHASAKPVLLFSCEEVIPFLDHHFEQADLERATAQALQRVMTQCKQVTPVYDTLVCYLGEPWVTSSLRTARMERKRNFTIKQKTIDDLVERETKLFEQETLRKYEGQEEIGLLEISQPWIDAHGYRVTKPLGEQAKTLDVHMVFSLAPVHVVRTLGEVYLDVFHRSDVLFRSYDHAAYSLMHSLQEGTLIHVGGLTTTLALFRKGLPSMSASLPTGIHTYEQELMQSFALTRNQIPATCALVRDQNILNQARDIYTGRMIDAYSSLHDALMRYILESRKYGHLIQGPLVVVGLPLWMEHILPLLEKDLKGTGHIPSRDLLEEVLVLTHEAYHLPTSLIAVLSAEYRTKLL